MRLALDTNRYSDLQRGLPDVVALLESPHEIFIPFIVLAEIRVSFVHGTRAAENERKLRAFLALDGISVLFPDPQTLHHFLILYWQLKHQVTPIPQNDLWVSALLLPINFSLCY